MTHQQKKTNEKEREKEEKNRPTDIVTYRGAFTRLKRDDRTVKIFVFSLFVWFYQKVGEYFGPMDQLPIGF